MAITRWFLKYVSDLNKGVITNYT